MVSDGSGKNRRLSFKSEEERFFDRAHVDVGMLFERIVERGSAGFGRADDKKIRQIQWFTY